MRRTRLPAVLIEQIKASTGSLLKVAIELDCHVDTVARHRNGRPYPCKIKVRRRAGESRLVERRT